MKIKVEVDIFPNALSCEDPLGDIETAREMIEYKCCRFLNCHVGICNLFCANLNLDNQNRNKKCDQCLTAIKDQTSDN
jgi:hypothetical protein